MKTLGFTGSQRVDNCDAAIFVILLDYATD